MNSLIEFVWKDLLTKMLRLEVIYKDRGDQIFHLLLILKLLILKVEALSGRRVAGLFRDLALQFLYKWENFVILSE